MLYAEFSDTKYECFDRSYDLLFTSGETHDHLFEYAVKDLSSLPILFERYISNKIDTTDISLKKNQGTADDLLKIEETLKSLHPYYEWEYKEIIAMEIKNYFNSLLVYLHHALSRDEYSKIIQVLIPSSFVNDPTEYNDFYNAYAKWMGLEIDDTIDIAVLNAPSQKPQGFIKEISTQNAISNMLYFILDIAVPDMEKLTTSQRTFLYGNIFQRDSEPMQITKRTSFAPIRFRNNSPLADKHKMDNIFNPLSNIKQINTAYNGIPANMTLPINSAIEYVSNAKTTKVYEEYEIKSLHELLYLEILSMIQAGTMIRKCKNCGKYFIIDNRKTVYCDRIDESGMCCSAVGSKRSFQQKVDQDEALKIYTRAYKTHHARVRKNIMSQEAFRIWRSEAKANLEKTRNGELDISAFQEWLKK